jgi:hypothetical protein
MNRLKPTPPAIHPIHTDAATSYDYIEGKNCIMLTQDDACKSLLLHLGLIDKLAPPPPHNAVGIYFTTQQFYGMASAQRGHPNPIDNGYFVVMVRRSVFSEEHAMQLFRQSFGDTCIGPAEDINIDTDPSNN